MEVRGEAGTPASGGVGTRLLERVAVTLSSTLELKEVLRRLAELGREASGAQRCSIALIEGRRLVPAAAIGDEPDEDLWSAFRGMPPIELGWEEQALIEEGAPLAFADARTSPYVPPSWVERFSLRAIAIVPLLAHGEPVGIMAVDWPQVRAIPPDELAALEAIGVYAGLAVRNARLHEHVVRKSEAQGHLVAVAASLNSASSLPRVLGLICSSFERLLETTHVSVTLADPSDPLRVHTLASRGEPWFMRRGETMLPEELATLDRVRSSPSGPLVYETVESGAGSSGGPASIRSAALFPLFGIDGVIGSVVTGFGWVGGPAETELETGQTLAELAAAAIGRADLDRQLRRRVGQLELLHRLSAVARGRTPINEVFGAVNDALDGELGIHLDRLVVDDARVREAVGACPPTTAEAAILHEWRRALAGGEPISLRRIGAGLLVPAVHGERVVGGVAASLGVDAVGIVDEEFLVTIGARCAEVADRSVETDGSIAVPPAKTARSTRGSPQSASPTASSRHGP